MEREPLRGGELECADDIDGRPQKKNLLAGITFRYHLNGICRSDLFY